MRVTPLALALLAGCTWVGDAAWTQRQDWDGDGFVSYTFGGADCDDGDATVFPGADEIWYDGIDQDCDGSAEFDLDGDGYEGGDERGDCDDDDPLIFPGAAEACDGADSDCDGVIPDDEADADGDGWRVCDGDCDDDDPAISPGAAEVCDELGLDEDCDGDSNDGDADVTGAAAWYPDSDGDGYGDSDTELLACQPPLGAAAEGGDCDDGDPSIAPGADEGCDGVDTDCDGSAAAEEIEDLDGDGFPACMDCDDSDGDVYPGAPEFCDDRPTDCDLDWVDDDDLLSFVDADGNWSALSPGPAGRPAEHVLSQPGTVYVCEGQHLVRLVPEADITVVGVDGAARSMLEGDEGGGPALDIQAPVTVTVSDVTLLENGLRCSAAASVSLTDARITDSSGLDGGGFSLRGGCEAHFEGVSVTESEADVDAGGLGGGGYLDLSSSLSCADCDFLLNSPDDLNKAGASYTWDASGLSFTCPAGSAECL